jgi:hypothetical protein
MSAREAASGKKCIGMVLPVPTKAIVRQTNAFVRGARYQESDVKVVIRWVGGGRDTDDAGSYDYTAQSFDYSTTSSGPIHREELLAAQLADLGCTVVGHRTETQRVVSFVETRLKGPVSQSASHATLYSLGVDAAGACNPGLAPSATSWFQSCLGTVYWNWGGLYAKVFDEIHRGVWTGEIDDEAFLADTTSVARFDVSPFTSLTGIGAQDLQNALQKAADDGFNAVFQGPLTFTGQRDLNRDGVADADQSVLSGVIVQPEELARMCWFVDGTFELPDPTVVGYDSLVPAMVPGGPAVTGQVTSVSPSDAGSMKKYGDVMDFIHKAGGDPTSVMDCALY